MNDDRRPLAAAALLAVAVLATAITLVVSDRGSGSVVLSDWLAAAEEAGSYRFRLEQTVTGGGPDSRLGSLFNLEGSVDLEGGISRTVTSFDVLGVKTSCTYLTRGEETIFVSVHESRRGELGASWLSSEVDTAIAGFSFPIRPDRLDDDPAAFIEGLDRSGTGEVDGVPTTTYDGDLDLAALYPQADDQPGIEELGDGIPVTLEIDEAGLLRRMAMSLSTAGETTIGLRMDFFDYGEPVDLRLPDPASVKPGRPEQIATACFPSA